MTPIEIISQGKWEQALFTTYALSLSFFESQLLKEGLSRNGCRDIDIVTDVDGYEMSLSERLSSRVGTQYRLIPAAMRNGVFHPKIVLLSGEGDLVMLLGSGNLTFGGYGRNLEALEVFRASKHPSVFADLEQMLLALSRRSNLRFADSEWLKKWSQVASTGSKRGSDSNEETQVRLIHSTEESIGRTLQQMAMEGGGVRDVRVLSPYYDPDADGILNFAETLGASSLTIGLLPKREEKNTFPFRKTRKTSVSMKAAVIEAPQDGRNLHAKWMEIDLIDGRSLLVVGSVNGTRKSLMTSDNIEVTIVRTLAVNASSPLRWIPCEPPQVHQSSIFSQAGLKKRMFVYASICSDGRLIGQIISAEPLIGSSQASLNRSDGLSKSFVIAAEKSGSFSIRPPDLQQFCNGSALQIMVETNTREAVGWVHQDSLLQATRRGFLNLGTLMRLMNSEGQTDDDIELLNYLTISAQRHLSAFVEKAQAKQPELTDPDEPDGDQCIPLEMLAGGVEETAGKPSLHLGQAASIEVNLNYLLKQLRVRILIDAAGEPSRTKTFHARDADSVDDAENEAKEEKAREVVLKTAFEKFQERMLCLVDEQLTGADKRAAYVMWLEIGLLMLMDRLSNFEEAEEFARHWFYRVTRQTRQSSNPEALRAYVLGVGLVMAALSVVRDHGDTPELRRELSILHEHLNACHEHPLVMKDFEQVGVFDDVHPLLVIRLVTILDTPPDLRAVCHRLLDTPSLTQQIELIKQRTLNGQPLDEDLPLWTTPPGREWRHEIQSTGGFRDIVVQKQNLTYCPQCYLVLSRAARADLQHYRFAKCSNCLRFIADVS